MKVTEVTIEALHSCNLLLIITHKSFEYNVFVDLSQYKRKISCRYTA